jgi:hypothetical protein
MFLMSAHRISGLYLSDAGIASSSEFCTADTVILLMLWNEIYNVDHLEEQGFSEKITD